MKLSTVFLAALLAGASSAWKLGDKATGMTDPNVTKNCTLWANDTSDDTCEKLEKHDFLQLHEWNPALIKDPCVPIKDWSYCVDSPVATNSLASLVGTDAPILKNPYPSSTSPPDVTVISTAGSSTTVTAISDAASSATTSATTSSSTATGSSSVTSTTTGSSPAQETGGAASFGSVNIPVVVLSIAFSTVIGSGLAIYFD